MTWDDAFEQAKYLPVNGPDLAACDQHPQHAVMRYSDGTDRCTSGHVVAPKVRDSEDRIGEALAGKREAT